MKKSEVITLVQEIVDYSNYCLGRTIAELAQDESQVGLSREQATKLISIIQATVSDSAFTVLATK